jgi:hypothetical protein
VSRTLWFVLISFSTTLFGLPDEVWRIFTYYCTHCTSGEVCTLVVSQTARSSRAQLLSSQVDNLRLRYFLQFLKDCDLVGERDHTRSRISERQATAVFATRSSGGRLSYLRFIDAIIVIAKRFESSSPPGTSSGLAAALPSLSEALELIDGMAASLSPWLLEC